MMLKKKYYDGTQVHRIISEEVKDYDTIMKILKRFADEPSAQPEIIRCKDCKFWTKQEASLQGRCAWFGMYPTGGWYCANADMRGEKENENNIQ